MFDNGWNLQWFEDRLKGREATFRCVSEICKKTECQTVLDVGGGIGLLRRFLPTDIKHDVVDLSSKAKQFGEKLFPDVRFITGTIDNIVDEYDAIIAIWVVEHMNDYESFLKTAWNRANKIIVISFGNGLDDNERIKKRFRNYWNNKYSFPKLESFINTELHPVRMEVIKIDVIRDYSPELILVLYKE